MNNFMFDNMYAFYVILLLFILFFVTAKIKDYESYFSSEMLNKIIIGKNKKKINFILLIVSFILLILALARPIIQNKPIKVTQSSIDIIVAFDISKSMQCDDIYPNRLQFAKNKFNDFLTQLKDERVGAIGFSSRAFLVAPITNDYFSLKYLVDNLSTKYISLKGSSIQEALETTNNLLKLSSRKALVIFTDGTDNKEFLKQIQYAKENNIKVFVYAIATKKGGVIKTQDGVQKDKNGNIVVTRLNENIKNLALDSDGAYLQYSTRSSDIKLFIDTIRDKFVLKDKKDVVIKNNQELFYIPLGLAIFAFLVSISGFRRR
jgi:Ca-activated chloride channel family protein